MEERLNILNKYLQLYDEKKYRDTFYNFTYSEIIQHFIDYEIYNYYKQYGSLPNKYVKEIITINDTEMKKKVFPLILFMGKNFYKKLYKNGFFNDLKEFLLKDFHEINFDINLINIDKDSYLFENQSSIKQEIMEFNFRVILDFGISQPTIGNYQYAKFIYFIADKMFFEEYCEVLSNKDSFSFLNLTNSLEWDDDNADSRNKKRRMKLLEHITGKNKIILEIRFLRDLLCYEDTEQFEHDNQLIKKIILDLSQDSNIWKYFCDYFFNVPRQYKRLFQSLGALIEVLEKDQIDILIDSIKIDNFTNNRKILNNCFFSIKNNETKKEVFKKIFYRWNEFVNCYEEYLGSIILTDIIDVVIHYIRVFGDKTIIIKNINNIIGKLCEIDNFWFKDRLEQENYYYKQMSKLFVYGSAIDRFHLSELKEKISYICKNSYILTKEHVYQNNKSTLQLFKEHII